MTSAPTERQIRLSFNRGSAYEPSELLVCWWEPGTAWVFTTDRELIRELKARNNTLGLSSGSDQKSLPSFVLRVTWREIRELVDGSLAGRSGASNGGSQS